MEFLVCLVAIDQMDSFCKQPRLLQMEQFFSQALLKQCLLIHQCIAYFGSKLANQSMLRLHCKASRQLFKSLQCTGQMQCPVDFLIIKLCKPASIHLAKHCSAASNRALGVQMPHTWPKCTKSKRLAQARKASHSFGPRNPLGSNNVFTK